MNNEHRTPDPVQGFSQRVEEAWPRIPLPAPLERSAAVSKTSRSAWEVRRRRQLAACCGWSRTTQPRSVPTARGEGRVRGHANSNVSGSLLRCTIYDLRVESALRPFLSPWV